MPLEKLMNRLVAVLLIVSSAAFAGGMLTQTNAEVGARTSKSKI